VARLERRRQRESGREISGIVRERERERDREREREREPGQVEENTNRGRKEERTSEDRTTSVGATRRERGRQSQKTSISGKRRTTEHQESGVGQAEREQAGNEGGSQGQARDIGIGRLGRGVSAELYL
jgi:hypothetical protein